MSALQESRRELMVQLEGLMRLLKVPPHQTHHVLIPPMLGRIIIRGPNSEVVWSPIVSVPLIFPSNSVKVILQPIPLKLFHRNLNMIKRFTGYKNNQKCTKIAT
jgi:hypothetical protein